MDLHEKDPSTIRRVISYLYIRDYDDGFDEIPAVGGLMVKSSRDWAKKVRCIGYGAEMPFEADAVAVAENNVRVFWRPRSTASAISRKLRVRNSSNP